MILNLENYIGQLEKDWGLIPKPRKEILSRLADYMASKQKSDKAVELVFICIHNSRRSHFSQVWAQIAAHYYGLENLYCFSGGTVATEIHPNTVAALKRSGLSIILKSEGENPLYHIYYSEKEAPIEGFSKTYDDPSNPQGGFAAVMTCSEAEKECPFIATADFRIAVTFIDPKESDGTVQETAVYDERCRQISSEMFWLMKKYKESTGR